MFAVPGLLRGEGTTTYGSGFLNNRQFFQFFLEQSDLKKKKKGDGTAGIWKMWYLLLQND